MAEGERFPHSSDENSSESNEDDVSVIAVIGQQTDKRVPKDIRFLRSSSRSESTAVDEKSEPILFNQEPVKRARSHDDTENRRVVELADGKSKMALREQLRRLAMTSLATSGEAHGNSDDTPEDLRVLQKLPAETIVIKQTSDHNTKSYKEDSDYVRDSTETSSGSSSTSGYAAEKVKRIHRAIRNKNRVNVEIRRNPMRVTKKEADKDFSRPRQRLLSARRKAATNAEGGRRAKSSTMPYMNTRSVTRKMCTVGATYQAPTKGDETEWKEWPVHGMHERPVYHPQAGLAVEYLGRYFTSFDGLFYREIVSQPDIEVVSVDPRSDWSLSSGEKPRSRRTKSKSRTAAKPNLSDKSPQSFVSCMHDSLHCVLAYCSQVMSPSYRKNVDEKLKHLVAESTSSNVEENKQKETRSFDTIVSNKENTNGKERKLTRDVDSCVKKIPIGLSTESYYPRGTRTEGVLHEYNCRADKTKLTHVGLKKFGTAQVFHAEHSQQNAFNSVKASTVQSFQPAANQLNLTKLEDTSISDDTLMEMSSIYKNFVPNEEYAADSLVESKTCRKILLKSAMLADSETRAQRPFGKQGNFREGGKGKENNYQIKDKVETMNYSAAKSWATNDASEIAKILSEYNRSTTKTPAIQGQACFAQVNAMKSNCRARNAESCNEGAPGENLEDGTHTGIQFLRGKWRRFHLTLEKLKSSKIFNERTGDRSTTVNRQKRETINVDDVPTLNCPAKRSQQLDVDKKDCTARESSSTTQTVQELLENTAILYCAAAGVHQDDLANYMDTLDVKQSMEWLQEWNNSNG